MVDAAILTAVPNDLVGLTPTNSGATSASSSLAAAAALRRLLRGGQAAAAGRRRHHIRFAQCRLHKLALGKQLSSGAPGTNPNHKGN